MGTAPRMTVAENLLLAMKRGQKRPLTLRKINEQRALFTKICQEVGNGLKIIWIHRQVTFLAVNAKP